jgi:two-component sensor histidine kinase
MSQDVDASRMAELEADNHRLRRLLEQSGMPSELRHRSRNNLSLFRAIIRRSAEFKHELNTYVAHLEDRLDAVARAQSALDEHGTLNLRKVLIDELHYYRVSDERYSLLGPEVELQPKAGQLLALAIHELAVNAIEHGPLGADNGKISVSWTVTEEEHVPVFLLVWDEAGDDVASNREPSAPEGFGTDVLTRMLRYEVQAETQLDVSSTGNLRCTIHIPLPASVGHVLSS